ncbi:hypothetical protein H2200_006443 [Cladophialophora chaetospira]|uniref:Velvet domain-containing protein n=1 Tax=Cladophialophora chaetospira TaxID=386627 RepID=A0AA38X8S1_9EURO|nr:hypothetical protein H2200_006443 [Cladophialophora chaetospira]
MTLMPCIGTTVSSLNLTKVAKTTEKRGSFVFSDIIPQFKENLPGQYKFRFTLMDVRVDEVLDAAYALSITDMLSPAFEVEFVHKVPAALESTQLTRDLREGGVNLKLKKKPKARANKNKISWSIEGPIDSTPQPLSVMGPAYGLINGPTEGISFNSMSVRDRIKISTRSLPVPTSSHQDLLNQHTMAYSQHPLTTTTTSAMEYPQASATMMPRAYHAPAHGQHFGQIPLPMSYPSSDLMAPDEYWRPPNTDIQYPHVTATAVNGASTSTSGQYTGTMATADSGPPASTNGQYTGMMATADSGPPTSTNGQYTGRMATADSRPPTSANGHFPDIGSVGAYGVPAHMTGQYADAMPAIGYGPTINGNDQYSVSFWPGCYPDGAEEEGEQYL